MSAPIHCQLIDFSLIQFNVCLPKWPCVLISFTCAFYRSIACIFSRLSVYFSVSLSLRISISFYFLYKTIITVAFLFIFHWISKNSIFDQFYFTCLPMHIGFCRMPFQLYLYASGIWQRICSVWKNEKKYTFANSQLV